MASLFGVMITEVGRESPDLAGGLVHRLLLASVIIALAADVSAQRRSGLDAPIPPFQVPPGLSPCYLEDVVAEFAKRNGVLVGFERTSNCITSGAADPSLAGMVLSGISARTALDRLLALDATYRWEEQDGVAVIRPAAAWTDPDDALNLPAVAFNVADADLGISLGAWMKVSVGPGRSDNALLTRPLSVAFSGGTALDALNATIRAHQESGWYAGVELPSRFRAQFPRFSVSIRTFDGSSLSVSRPLSGFLKH
jgi:hypothetical protein